MKEPTFRFNVLSNLIIAAYLIIHTFLVKKLTLPVRIPSTLKCQTAKVCISNPCKFVDSVQQHVVTLVGCN